MRRKEVPDRQYTDEFKVEAVRPAESIGGSQAAKRLGMPESSLSNWTPHSAHEKPIAPNVLDRRFDGRQTSQAWVADITFITTAEGWLYLACIMDLESWRTRVGR